MDNYPLKANKYNPRTLEPLTNAYVTEEYLSRRYDLYLTSEYTRDDDGTVRRYYRLNANSPHSVEMALSYDIKCPKCKTNTLKQVGRSLGYYKLGLYECPVCDREGGR